MLPGFVLQCLQKDALEEIVTRYMGAVSIGRGNTYGRFVGGVVWGGVL